MEILGIGSKMVKPIGYWLQAIHLCEEQNQGGNRARQQFVTENFGRIIEQYDPYFDDIFTLSLIHYHIVSNKHELCTMWNVFFNEYEGENFTRDNMYETCEEYLKKRLEQKVAGVFKRDIDIYLTAAIVGLNFGLRREVNNCPDKAKIHVDTVLKEQDNLIFVFRIAMLVDNSTGLNADEKINRTI